MYQRSPANIETTRYLVQVYMYRFHRDHKNIILINYIIKTAMVSHYTAKKVKNSFTWCIQGGW